MRQPQLFRELSLGPPALLPQGADHPGDLGAEAGNEMQFLRIRPLLTSLRRSQLLSSSDTAGEQGALAFEESGHGVHHQADADGVAVVGRDDQ